MPQIQALEQRNKRVEADTAWETSKTRKGIIAAMTYIIIVIFLKLIEAPHPYLNALVPTGGFLLSTLTLSYFKKIWTQKLSPK